MEIYDRAEVKVKAKKLLDLFGADGKNWTRNTLARDGDGSPTDPGSSEAESWCLVGGCRKLNLGIEWLATEVRVNGFPNEDIAFFNDSRATGWNGVRDFLSTLVHKGTARKEKE